MTDEHKEKLRNTGDDIVVVQPTPQSLEERLQSSYKVEHKEAVKLYPKNAFITFNLEHNPHIISMTHAREVASAIHELKTENVVNAFIAEELVKVSKAEIKQYSGKLRENADKLREFILNDISTLLFSFDTGVLEAQDTLRQILDSEDLTLNLGHIKSALIKGADIKLIIFVATLLGIPPELLLVNKDTTLEQIHSILKEVANV